MRQAKLFKNGQSQAVRLPKEFRFNGERVGIKKVGPAVVLFPLDNPWESLIEALGRFSPDFLDERNQPPDQVREKL
jgi:antitoxin VapB